MPYVYVLRVEQGVSEHAPKLVSIVFDPNYKIEKDNS